MVRQRGSGTPRLRTVSWNTTRLASGDCLRLRSGGLDYCPYPAWPTSSPRTGANMDAGPLFTWVSAAIAATAKVEPASRAQTEDGTARSTSEMPPCIGYRHRRDPSLVWTLRRLADPPGLPGSGRDALTGRRHRVGQAVAPDRQPAAEECSARSRRRSASKHSIVS